ncbi:MAG: hypothetical protein DSM106950_18510 [Stigonema ocellatum SAG 48.90 = DSM 106950]|nr:hypothetical protein [Stigonema ocellatum SAG 48.90 = DSM 106950]
MKNKLLGLRISERRFNKIHLYAAQKDKSMTQVIEEFIDSLKLEDGKNSDTSSID